MGTLDWGLSKGLGVLPAHPSRFFLSSFIHPPIHSPLRSFTPYLFVCLCICVLFMQHGTAGGLTPRCTTDLLLLLGKELNFPGSHFSHQNFLQEPLGLVGEAEMDPSPKPQLNISNLQGLHQAHPKAIHSPATLVSYLSSCQHPPRNP